MKKLLVATLGMLACSTLPAFAEWGFSDGMTPNATTQSNNMSLELQCDRIRFAPAGYEDSQDIIRKQAMSIRFMKNGSTEVGAFQVGRVNATLQIVDNYPVEILFNDASDYGFVLDEIAANAILNLSMADQDVSYGIFSLKGSSWAIRSLRSACGSASQTESSATEAPEGVVYCGGGQVQRRIEYLIRDDAPDQWDAIVTINGGTVRAMTSYSYFGNAETPRGFVVALLGEDRSEFFVFKDGSRNYIELGDYQYSQCN